MTFGITLDRRLVDTVLKKQELMAAHKRNVFRNKHQQS